MTENPAASTNDAASLLESLDKTRASARDVLNHGRHDIELLVLTGVIAGAAYNWEDGTDSKIFTASILVILGTGIVVRTRRLHSLGGSIGLPTWIGIGLVVVTMAVARLWLSDTAGGWLVFTTYAGIFVALGVIYRRPVMIGFIAVAGGAVVAAGLGAPGWVVALVGVALGAPMLYVFRKDLVSSSLG